MPDGVTLFLGAVLAVVAWLGRQRFRAVEERLVGTPKAAEVEARFDKLRQSFGRAEAERDRVAHEDRARFQEECEGLETRVRVMESTLEETVQSGRDEAESLKGRLTEMKSALQNLGEQVQSLQQRLEMGAVPIASGVGHVVRYALEEQGFEHIRFLDSRVESQAPASQEIAVEARRAGAAYKGSVRLENGGVASVDLRPGYGVFP